MRKLALGLYSFAGFGLTAVAFLPVMGAAHRFHRNDPTQRVPGQWMRRFGRTCVRLSPMWRFSIEGEAPADIDQRAYVVVANHLSDADPFLLSFLPWDMRWLAKEELYRLPLIGPLMRYGGDIPIARKSREGARHAMEEARRSLDAGISIMMFPEGTRSRDGNLLPFKDGAFRLAIEAGVPILPIAIAGTEACRPKGSKWIGEASARARVLSPIETAGVGVEDVERIREQARARIEEAVLAMRGAGEEGRVVRSDEGGVGAAKNLLDRDPPGPPATG